MNFTYLLIKIFVVGYCVGVGSRTNYLGLLVADPDFWRIVGGADRTDHCIGSDEENSDQNHTRSRSCVQAVDSSPVFRLQIDSPVTIHVLLKF